MNKTEQAAMEALVTELAFRWPMEVEPVPMMRAEIDAEKQPVTPQDASFYKSRNIVTGWGYNDHSATVFPLWSDGTYHGHGHTGDNGSRDMWRIYRTKDAALPALRWALCRKYAGVLRGIDRARGESNG